MHFHSVTVLDTIVIVCPYPFWMEENVDEVDGRPPKIRYYKTGLDDLLYHLVFFNTFELLKLPISGPMEDSGVIRRYEQSPTPCLYVAWRRDDGGIQHGGQ